MAVFRKDFLEEVSLREALRNGLEQGRAGKVEKKPLQGGEATMQGHTSLVALSSTQNVNPELRFC